MWSPGGCFRFDMSGEPVQNSLPTLALDFRFVFGLHLKSLPHKDSIGGVGELNPDVPTSPSLYSISSWGTIRV